MRAALAIACTLGLLAPEAHAQEAAGFAELRLSLSPGVDGKVWELVERIRPTFEAELGERVKLVATIEGALHQGRDLGLELERTLRASELGPVLDSFDCRWPQRSNTFFGIDDAGDYLEVDRLYADFYGGDFDLRAGRQALNWGSAQFFNPTDPFPEVLLAEPWRPRRGVNAIRASVPFGEAHDVSAVIAGDDAFTELRAAGRVRVNFAGTDFALVGAWRGADRDALVGIDLRGTLGVGWWIEAAYLLGDNPHEELAIGIDYSFPVLERLVIFAQYYRNGAGSPEGSGGSAFRGAATISAPECDGFELPIAREHDPFAPFTTGRDYALAGATIAIDPELSLNLAALHNLGDGSGMLIPTVSYALLDWLELAASAQIPYAFEPGGGELKPGREDLALTFAAPQGAVSADLSGMVPAATLTFWTRASF